MEDLEKQIVETWYYYEENLRLRSALERRLGRISSALPRRAPSLTKHVQLGVLATLGQGAPELEEYRSGEKEWKGKLEELAKRHPLYSDLSRVKGLGPFLIGCLIAASGDIGATKNVSGYWKSFGLDVLPDGSAPRKMRGKKRVERRLPAMPLVLKVSFLLSRQLLLAKGKAYGLYVKERDWYGRNRPQWPPIRQHKAARRVMEKVFLSCVWERWRNHVGLPAPNPTFSPSLDMKVIPVTCLRISWTGRENSTGQARKPSGPANECCRPREGVKTVMASMTAALRRPWARSVTLN